MGLPGVWLEAGVAVFWFAVLFGAFWILWDRLGLDVTRKLHLTSCCVSYFHSIPLILFSALELLAHPYILDAPNTLLSSRVIAYSLGFFTIDIAVLSVVGWREYGIYLAHHSVCVTYEISALVLGRGAMSVMALIFVGEITSPLLNICTIASKVANLYYPGKVSLVAGSVFDWVFPGFVIALLGMRVVVGPLVALHMLWYFLLSGNCSDEIPVAWRVVWVAAALAVPLGTIPTALDFSQRLKQDLALSDRAARASISIEI